MKRPTKRVTKRVQSSAIGATKAAHPRVTSIVNGLDALLASVGGDKAVAASAATIRAALTVHFLQISIDTIEGCTYNTDIDGWIQPRRLDENCLVQSDELLDAFPEPPAAGLLKLLVIIASDHGCPRAVTVLMATTQKTRPKT